MCVAESIPGREEDAMKPPRAAMTWGGFIASVVFTALRLIGV